MWLKDPDSVWIGAVVTKNYSGAVLHVETEETLESREIAIKTDNDLPPLRYSLKLWKNPDVK